MNTVWLRIVTDQGLEGWGEGFGHASAATTMAVLNTQLAPAVLGQDARDIAGLRARLSKAFHGFGRNGAHVFALSALDIALWDIAGKAAGLPLWRLLGAHPSARCPPMPACCATARPAMVAAACERAVARAIATSSCTRSPCREVRAARAGDRAGCEADGGYQLPVDGLAGDRDGAPHARLRPDLARGAGLAARAITPAWHGCAAKAACRSRPARTPPACTTSCAQFEAGALDVAQPSVIKIGGRHRMLEIAALAKAFGVRVVPHCAYFGAGFLASLHATRRSRRMAPFERLFIDLEASPFHDLVVAQDGRVDGPGRPGLGRDPDMDVLRRYACRRPTVFARE